MTQTAGAIRAALHINEFFDWMELNEAQLDTVAAIIESETHNSDMLAFIEWIAEWKLEGKGGIFALHKKVIKHKKKPLRSLRKHEVRYEQVQACFKHRQAIDMPDV
jgi:hypothetical protein